MESLKNYSEADHGEPKIESYPRPPKDISKTLTLFQKSRESLSESIETSITLLKLKKHTSHKRFDQLDKICLKDMKVNHVHLGKYLLCRTVEEAFYMKGVNTIIEDETGEVENLCISNCTPNNQLLSFPKNTNLIIKEPFLKMKNTDDCYIEIESPSDIQIVYNSNIEKWKTPESKLSQEELKLLGNQSFSNKDYETAIKFYTLALENNEDFKILNNRALCFLNIQKFNMSYLDCMRSIEINPDNEKAYFRLGRTLYSMRQFERAVEAFKNCLNFNPKNQDALNELDKANDRVRESKTGDYDFKKLILDCRHNVLRHDIADYLSSHLEIKSKILKAKIDIKRGTLLIGSKAVSITYQKELKIKLASTTQNFMDLVHKLNHNSHLLKSVYEIEKIEDFLVENQIVDISKIESIAACNSFQSTPVEFFSNFKPEPNDLDDNIGIWVTPSYLTHSCLPNTKRVYFNDVVLIYASEDIKQGDTITTAYVENYEPYKERVRVLKEHGVNECKCELCKMDREDPLTEQRDNYIIENRDRIKKLVDEDSKDIDEGLKFFNTIKDLYSNRTKYKYGLCLALVYCASLFRNKGKLDKSAKIFMDLFEMCKDYQEKMAFYGIVEAINDYFLWFDMDKTKECYQKLKKFSIGHEEYFLLRCDAKIMDYENIQQLLQES